MNLVDEEKLTSGFNERAVYSQLIDRLKYRGYNKQKVMLEAERVKLRWEEHGKPRFILVDWITNIKPLKVFTSSYSRPGNECLVIQYKGRPIGIIEVPDSVIEMQSLYGLGRRLQSVSQPVIDEFSK